MGQCILTKSNIFYSLGALITNSSYSGTYSYKATQNCFVRVQAYGYNCTISIDDIDVSALVAQGTSNTLQTVLPLKKDSTIKLVTTGGTTDHHKYWIYKAV